MYTLTRSSVCPAWERAGKHHTNPSGAVRHTDCQDTLLSSRDWRSQSGLISFLAVCLFKVPALWGVVLYKVAPLVPCHAVMFTEVQESTAQRDREAPKGQLCTKEAEGNLIARVQ